MPSLSDCTLPSSTSRKRACTTSGNDQNSGSMLSNDIGGDEKTEVVIRKGEALPETDGKNSNLTPGGETSEDSSVAVQQQSLSNICQSRGGAGSNASLMTSGNCNLKGSVKIQENREKIKGNDDEAITTKIERSREILGINKEEVASEKLKRELQQLSVKNCKSQDDDEDATSSSTVPKKEKTAAAAAESNVIDLTKKGDSHSGTTTGTKNESTSTRSDHVQFMSDGSSNKASSNAGDAAAAAGQRLKLKGATSATDSGYSDPDGVDREGRTATDHNDMDVVVVNTLPPKQQQELLRRKRRRSELQMSSTASPSSLTCLPTAATAADNSLMTNCDDVDKVTARSADTTDTNDDLSLPSIKKLQTTADHLEEPGDDCALLFRKAATDTHASARAKTLKETTSGETENTDHSSRSSALPPNNREKQRGPLSQSVHKERIDSCTKDVIGGINSNEQKHQQQPSGVEILVDITDQTPVNQQQLEDGKGSMEGAAEKDSTTPHDFSARKSEEMDPMPIICNKVMRDTENGSPLVESDVQPQHRKGVSTMNGIPNGNGKSSDGLKCGRSTSDLYCLTDPVEFREMIAFEFMEGLIEVMCLEIGAEFHREAMTGIIPVAALYAPGTGSLSQPCTMLINSEPCMSYKTQRPGVDVFGMLSQRETTLNINCDGCGRSVSVLRYAQHLDKCTQSHASGRDNNRNRKNGGRVASRRSGEPPTTTSSSSDSRSHSSARSHKSPSQPLRILITLENGVPKQTYERCIVQLRDMNGDL